MAVDCPPPPPGIYLQVTAPLWNGPALRRELEKLKFTGKCIEWIEQRGWLSSDFTIKGDPETIKDIQLGIAEYNRRLKR